MPASGSRLNGGTDVLGATVRERRRPWRRPALACGAALALAPLVSAHAAAGTVPVTISIADQLRASATNISTSKGGAISGPIATFTDTDVSAPATDFTATIMWGDGINSGGTVAGSAGHFSVTGTHAYAKEGSYLLGMLVLNTPGGSHATANGTVLIADAALPAKGTKIMSATHCTVRGR